MIDLLLIYWPTMIAAALLSAALAALGALLVTRRSAVQALPVSQAAGFGVSLGLLAVHFAFTNEHVEHTAVPLLFGLAAAAGCFVLTQRIGPESQSRTAIHLAFFALFWSANQLLTGLFPSIESHSAALFFGDLVTLTAGESYFFIFLAGAGALYLARSWRAQAERAFLHSVFETVFPHRADRGFYLLSLLLICFSVQLLGLFFTLAALFVPTALYTLSRRTGAGRHLLRVAVCGALSAGAGFCLSLLEPRLVTTPLIAVFLGLFPLAHLVAERILFRCK